MSPEAFALLLEFLSRIAWSAVIGFGFTLGVVTALVTLFGFWRVMEWIYGWRAAQLGTYPKPR